MTTLSTAISVLLIAPLPATSLFLYEPSPYYSTEDSPFIDGIRSGTIYLEDFEDHALNTPFVTSPTNLSYFGTTVKTDFPLSQRSLGVDGDDGVVDGIVNQGDSWITIFRASFTLSRFKRFEFSPDEEGRYPTYVGIVVTEIGSSRLDVDINVANPDGIGLFSDGEFDPSEWFDRPPNPIGVSDSHRFIGFYAEEGIATLLMNNVLQVDHLQYGYAIPEPSTPLLTLLSLSFLLRRKRD